MQLRIFLFLLPLILIRAEPSVIDSLTIQLPDDEELTIPLAKAIPPEPPTDKPYTTSPSTTTASLPPGLSRQSLSSLHPSIRHSRNPRCPEITCYTIALSNGSNIFDCTSALPHNAMVTHQLDCNYWQPPSTALIPITAKFFTNGAKATRKTANHAVPLRIVLKPRTENPHLRITADAMISGALTRLVEAVRRNVRPQSNTPIKLSLIMVKIKKLTYTDLADVFRLVNLSGLILWNPDHLEETSFLQNSDMVSAFSETYVRLTFYCETENDFPAFGRLWLPWLRWQVKFLQCRGHYSCYRWPREERFCCNPDRCPETPGYVVTHADKLAKRDPTASLVHQQQVLDFYSCETESDLTNPLVELKKMPDCWAIPGYGMLDTTLRSTDLITTIPPSTSISTATVTTATTNTPQTSSPIIASSAIKSSEALTTTRSNLTINQAPSEVFSADRIRIRKLVIGIVCLLLLNLITLSCFVVACCWVCQKFRARQSLSEVAGSYSGSGTYEKQDYPYYDDEVWWQRFYAYDGASSEVTATPLFARSGSVIHNSHEPTPVMGSRDALMPVNYTGTCYQTENGLPPTGRNTMKASRSNELSLRRHPHTIVIEGEEDGIPPSPSHLMSQRHYD